MRRVSRAFQGASIESEDLDAGPPLRGAGCVLSRPQDQVEVLQRFLDGRIDQQRPTLLVVREEMPFVMAVAQRTRQQMVRPVEGPQRCEEQRLKAVDVRALVVAAVHAAFVTGSHPFQDGYEGGVDVPADGRVLPELSCASRAHEPCPPVWRLGRCLRCTWPSLHQRCRRGRSVISID
jgi:hypothetical protein